MTARPHALPGRAPPPTPAPRRVLRSDELLGSHKEIEILHGSQCYRLRVTSLGKLILTK
jgi:hemin uptake protein HemP